MLVLEVAAALALLLALLWLRFYLTAPPPTSGFKTLEQVVEGWQRSQRGVRGRARRRGGYVKPPASLVLSPATTSTTGVTLTLVGGSSSSPPPGAASAVTVIRPTPLPGSSGTALGWSTGATEDLGASGLPLAGAALTSSTGSLRSYVWPDGTTRFYQDGAA